MIKEAIDRIVDLSDETRKGELEYVDNLTYYWDGESYTLIETPEYIQPREDVRSLDAVVKLLTVEYQGLPHPVFVEVQSHRDILVYTSPVTKKAQRVFLYKVTCDTPAFTFSWSDYESAIIALRSQFIQNEGTEYALKLLASITDEDSVKTEDNGLSQTVETKKGISIKAVEQVKSIIKLRPYRTYLEVEQPESEFLIRLQEGGRVGLFEVDGGMWKLEAKRNIAAYLEKEFAGLDDVVVMA